MELMTEKIFYPTLRAELARRNITQTTLAKVIGVAQNTLSDKMKGKSPFTFEEACKIYNYLGFTEDVMSIRELFAGGPDE